jgi:hypothetical protein
MPALISRRRRQVCPERAFAGCFGYCRPHKVRACSSSQLPSDYSSDEVQRCAVGRGCVSLLTDLDTWHSKTFRDIGLPLIYSRQCTSVRD